MMVEIGSLEIRADVVYYCLQTKERKRGCRWLLSTFLAVTGEESKVVLFDSKICKQLDALFIPIRTKSTCLAKCASSTLSC
jgi:hypothetical protein